MWIGSADICRGRRQLVEEDSFPHVVSNFSHNDCQTLFSKKPHESVSVAGRLRLACAWGCLQADERALHYFFSQWGPVAEVKIIYDNKRVSKGCARQSLYESLQQSHCC